MHPDAMALFQQLNLSDIGYGHPSSPNLIGRQAETLLEQSRQKIATLLNTPPGSEIIFTSTCTQACQWALQLLSPYITAISPIEHPAVSMAKDQISNHQFLPVTNQGQVQLPTNQDVQAIVCIHTHNELGIIQDLSQFKNYLICSDMSQSLGKIPIDLTQLNPDIAMFGAHKFMGPPGIGILYLKNADLYQEFGTGSRYFLDRPGTPDVTAIAATAKALKIAIQTLPNRTKSMLAFQSTLEQGLETKGFEIIGKSLPRSPNTTFVKINNNAREILLNLSQKDIHVGLGSACSSLYSDLSPTLKALNQTGTVDSYLRISQWGQYNAEDADYFLNILDEVL